MLGKISLNQRAFANASYAQKNVCATAVITAAILNGEEKNETSYCDISELRGIGCFSG